MTKETTGGLQRSSAPDRRTRTAGADPAVRIARSLETIVGWVRFWGWSAILIGVVVLMGWLVAVRNAPSKEEAEASAALAASNAALADLAAAQRASGS